MKVTDLIPDEHNANKGTQRGLKALDHSLRQYGAGRSILIDKKGRVIAGNKTVERAADIGLDDVIVVQSDGTKLVAVQRTDLDLETDKAARELAWADNRVGQLDLEWEPLQLAADLEAGLDLTGLFDPAELSEILERAGTELLKGKKDPGPQLDKAAELKEKWGTCLGQLWALGKHRLICGDCTDRVTVERVMEGEVAEMMVTDPPYGVDYDPLFRARALGAADRRAQQVINDDVSSWKVAFELFPGDIAYIWHGDKQAVTSGLDLQAVNFEIVATIVWRKPHSPFGQGHYNYQHEPCWYAVRKGKNHQWAGGKDTTVWDIALDETAEGGHGTQKPLECMARPIRNHTARVIYDPFLGSGTTLIACENLGRVCRACEIDPGYVAVSLQRWADLTGKTPALVDFIDDGQR